MTTPATLAAHDPEASAARSPWRFALLHILLPSGAFALLFNWLVLGGEEIRIAHALMNWEGGSWALRQHWLTKNLFHDGGRLLSGLAWIGVLAWLFIATRSGGEATLRRRLTYLALCVFFSVAAVDSLKYLILSDCPWDMQGFGGDRPLLDITEHRASDLPEAHCFPAAHASTGYAWLALYFALMPNRRRMLAGLATGLALGMSFGAVQQLRGAHFASHDLFSAAICWVTALVFLPMLRPSGTIRARSLDRTCEPAGVASVPEDVAEERDAMHPCSLVEPRP